MSVTSLSRPCGDDAPAAPDAVESSAERRFRPDIEGLRAVAVLLVVLYHAKLVGATGGYVGVDVFFVISGFLITRQLFDSQQRHGRVRLAEFYLRRIKRLLPAAVVVTLAVLGAARVWSSTLVAKDIARDAIYTALYGMNYHLAAEGTNYLSAAKAASPLQHFWSLAVEEQFYVGLPLLVLSVAIVQLRYQRGALLALIAAGVAFSLYLCVVTTATSAPVAYFSIGTRAWELGIGALTALGTPWLVRLPRALAALLSWMGLIAILWAGFRYTDATAFPGSAALLPVGGAALIVAGGTRRARWSAEMLLGRWIAQLLGKVSYSWYLWHWPVLVFAPLIMGHALGPSMRFQVLFVSLLLAVASYFHVELPGRRLRLHRPAWVLTGPALAGATAAVALVFASTLPALTGSGGAAETAVLETSDVAVVQQALAKSLHATTVPSNLTPGLAAAARDYQQARDCVAAYPEVKLAGDCVFGDPHGTRTVALFGDSHAAHWIGAFDKAAAADHWKVLLRSKVACPVSDVSYVDDHFKRVYTECVDWRRAAVADIVARKPDLVVASQADGTPGTKVTDAAWADGTARTLHALAAGGSRLVLLSDVPQPAQPLECLAAHLDAVDKCVTAPGAGSQYWPNRRSAVAAAARHSGATVVDTDLWMCSGDRCPPIVGNMPVYRDSGHLTHTYATWLAPVIRPLLDGSAGADVLTAALPALEKGLTTTTAPANLRPTLAKAAHDLPASGDCHLDFLVTVQGPCLFGDPDGTRTVVLFGDSHVNQWFGAFNTAAKKKHWKLINWTKAACPVADLPVDAPTLKRSYTECSTWRRAIVARIVALHPDLVIAGQSDAVKTGAADEAWAKATADTLRRVARPGTSAVLLEDNPYAPTDPPACLSGHLDDVKACNYARTDGYHDAGPNLHDVVAQTVRRAGFPVLDTGNWICGVEECPMIVGNMLVYRDRGHVTDTYATWLAPIVESLLVAPSERKPE